MKILFDGYWLISGPPSGRIVVTEIIRAWSEKYPADEIAVVVPGRMTSSELGLPENVLIFSSKLRIHPLINTLELPFIARQWRNVDAIYCQNFSALTKNSAIYLHDVLFQSNPEWFTRTERVYFSFMIVLAKFARNIFTSSESEKNRIERHNRRLKKVVATGLGLSAGLTGSLAPRKVAGLEPKTFLLSVGRLNARKNLVRTIEGALASSRLSPSFPLVVVGEASGKLEDLSEAARAAVSDGSVRFLGFVPNDELAWLYSNAAMMTFLSLGEGYGLPPIEAMAMGTRVLVSDIPVMHENLGDYAAYVNGESPDAIAAAICQAAHEDWRSGPIGPIATWSRVVEICRTEFQLAGAERKELAVDANS